MKSILCCLAVLFAACHSATGPQGIDPTVLITNRSSADTVHFTWRDGQGIAGTVTVLPGGTSCTRFVAQADSAYFDATANHPGGTAAYTQPWFDPGARPAWTMVYADVSPTGFGVTDVSPNEPC
ncbi:MAG TPA: hypothetical protein VIW26_06800 [Gemmatimonadales bacterium]|jgi:hypothetical protein